MLLSDLAAAVYMTGVIWTVQIVHYPLFARVGVSEWLAYHSAHTRLMTAVVLGPMVVELGTSGLLALASPMGLPRGWLWVGFVLAILTWAATFFVSVPLHDKLSQGFDLDTIHALIRTNWIRTALWTAHGLLMAGLLWKLLAERA